MTYILFHLNDPRLWELWHIPCYGSYRIFIINRTIQLTGFLVCVIGSSHKQGVLGPLGLGRKLGPALLTRPGFWKYFKAKAYTIWAPSHVHRIVAGRRQKKRAGWFIGHGPHNYMVFGLRALWFNLGLFGVCRNGDLLLRSFAIELPLGFTFCTTDSIDYPTQSSSFLGLPQRILNMNPQKELFWGLWVRRLMYRIAVKHLYRNAFNSRSKHDITGT